jgi:deoxyribonuclease V
MRVGAVFAATPRAAQGPGAAGDSAWVAAVAVVDGHVTESVVVHDRFDAPYEPGLLALREGRLLQDIVGRLHQAPEVLLVNATGRDHPRRAGLALHLGAACGLSTVGVTDRPLLAYGPQPGPEPGASSELLLEGELVGYVLRTQANTRSIVVHAGWRVDPPTARQIVMAVRGHARTPLPLREARRLARATRTSSHFG